MKQKLSAIRYIKNNKMRMSVLIISLALSFLLTYVTNFLLSATTETFRPVLLDYSKKIQYVVLAGSSIGVDVNNPDQKERESEYETLNKELCQKLRTHDKIKDAFYAQSLNVSIQAVIGKMKFRLPLVDKEKIPLLIEHSGVTLSEGHLPEKPGEVVLDKAVMINHNIRLNDYLNQEYFKKAFKVVGILEGDMNFCCGIATDEYNADQIITILSDNADISEELLKEGIQVRNTYDKIEDYKNGKECLEKDVIEPMGNSSKYIYDAVIILLSISLFIIYTMYLRDRHNEWCLYRSIGYSEGAIYFSIMRELLFTFVTALAAGAVLILISVIALNSVMIESKGLKARMFDHQMLGQILSLYVFLIGILQIPVRYAMYRIRTIDAADDDLY